MRCKQIQKLFIDASERGLDPQTKDRIEKHVSKCPKCGEFVAGLNLIRSGLQQIQVPSPSDQLLQRTRSACHAVLKAKGVVTEKTWLQSRSPTPKLVWIGLVVLLALTQLLVIPLFQDATENQILSFHGVMILVLMIQNITMLFFAPLLLDRFKSRSGWANLV